MYLTLLKHNQELFDNFHCVKSVRVRSYSGPHFPAFGLNMNWTGDKVVKQLTKLDRQTNDQVCFIKMCFTKQKDKHCTLNDEKEKRKEEIFMKDQLRLPLDPYVFELYIWVLTLLHISISPNWPWENAFLLSNFVLIVTLCAAYHI